MDFFFSTGSILPCSRWGCRQNFHQSFPSLVGLSLSLTDTGILLIPPGSTIEAGWRCTRGRPDGIPDWFCSIPPRPLICPFLWCHHGWSRLAFRNVSQVILPGGATILPVPMRVLMTVERWVTKRWTTAKMSLLSVTMPVYVIAKEVAEGWPARKKWFLSSSY